MKVSGPLFKWFGSKWLSSKQLPAPKYDQIVEPFAGGAGYSLRHAELKVTLCESDPHLFLLWRWLMKSATEAQIREIPIGVTEGTDIRELGLSEGQATLLKSWQRTNNVGDCWTISPWGNKPGQWTANTRARVASEFGAVSHWEVVQDGLSFMRMETLTATWFVDPPYQYNYQYRQNRLDYEELGLLCNQRQGQVIVCEAEEPVTGRVPAWLPFEPWQKRITSRRKKENNHHSSEYIYTADSVND